MIHTEMHVLNFSAFADGGARGDRDPMLNLIGFIAFWKDYEIWLITQHCQTAMSSMIRHL